RNRLAVIHLLRRTGREVPAPLVGFQQNLVGQHVELLLRLALDVAGAGIAQTPPDGALPAAADYGLARRRPTPDNSRRLAMMVAGPGMARTPPSAPLLTACDMDLHARATTSISSRRSALMWPARCSSIRNRANDT